jgi:hypothetical protein
MIEVIICIQCRQETPDWKWLPCINGNYKYPFCFECIVNNLEIPGKKLVVERSQRNFFTEVHEKNEYLS